MIKYQLLSINCISSSLYHPVYLNVILLLMILVFCLECILSFLELLLFLNRRLLCYFLLEHCNLLVELSVCSRFWTQCPLQTAYCLDSVESFYKDLSLDSNFCQVINKLNIFLIVIQIILFDVIGFILLIGYY